MKKETTDMKTFCSPMFYIEDSDGKKKERKKNIEENTLNPPMITAKTNIVQKSSYAFH